MSANCCSCGVQLPHINPSTACPVCRRSWGMGDPYPVLTMVDMGDTVYLSAQTVRKENVDAFCARLREMAR